MLRLFFNCLLKIKEQQIANFRNSVINGDNDLFKLSYSFIQQKEMHGIVIGGNIRCLLKLAGTEFMPDFKNKILLLESMSGTTELIETYLCQLHQLGVFNKVSGILLGTFTQMETEKCIPNVEALIKNKVNRDLPIAITRNIGHGNNSKGIIIGQELFLKQ